MKKLFKILPATLIIFAVACNSESGNESKKDSDNTENQTENIQKDEVNQTESNKETIAETKSIEASSSEKDKIEFDAFSYLKKYNITNKIFIKYNSDNTEIINKKRSELGDSHPLQDKNEMDANEIYAMKTKLDKNSMQYYHIVYSDGPSADPQFFLYPDGDIIMDHYTIYADRLYIPGNGNIYSAGHSNNHFNVRKKYIIGKEGLKEVEQPYYYVGLKTKTNKALTVYTDKTKGEVIANIPADYSIEVLIFDKKTNLFLIRTEFGLTGWVQVSTYGNIDIKGLVYMGD